MSFGFSIADAITLPQLAWTTVQNCRKACGEHDSLTHEVTSLHTVLRRLESEISNPESLINRRGDSCREEIQPILHGCQKILKILDLVLEHYSGLNDDFRRARQLWQKIRFGNGVVADLGEIRAKLTYYTSAISFHLNLVSMGSAGRVEQQMNGAVGDLRDIRLAVNEITAHLMVGNREGSVLTAYAGDDKAVWKQFRRELIEDGFSSRVIHGHKATIMAYIKELGDRGVLDEAVYEDVGEDQIEKTRILPTGSLTSSGHSSNARLSSGEASGSTIPGESAQISQTKLSLSGSENILAVPDEKQEPFINAIHGDSPPSYETEHPRDTDIELVDSHSSLEISPVKNEIAPIAGVLRRKNYSVDSDILTSADCPQEEVTRLIHEERARKAEHIRKESAQEGFAREEQCSRKRTLEEIYEKPTRARRAPEEKIQAGRRQIKVRERVRGLFFLGFLIIVGVRNRWVKG